MSERTQNVPSREVGEPQALPNIDSATQPAPSAPPAYSQIRFEPVTMVAHGDYIHSVNESANCSECRQTATVKEHSAPPAAPAPAPLDLEKKALAYLFDTQPQTNGEIAEAMADFAEAELSRLTAELERLTEIADEYSDHKLMCGQELRRELEQAHQNCIAWQKQAHASWEALAADAEMYEAKLAEQRESLEQVKAERDRLRAIGRALLYHDERGQGLGWQEAMKALRAALGEKGGKP